MCNDTNANNVLDENKVASLHNNAMLKVHPELFHEWNFTKNDDIKLDIYKITKSSAKKVWWICPKCGSDYDMTPDKRNQGRSCSYCAGKKVNHTNSLHAIKPDLASQWHPTLNGDLTPHDVTSNNAKCFWWYCKKCKSSYDMKISHKKSTSCPYCCGSRVNDTNSLNALNPLLSKHWHPTKNGRLTPNELTSKSNLKMWWKCEEGHEWEAAIYSRNEGIECPYCSNQKILVGYNDMWTTNPELAAMLANKEDGYKYSQGSNKKVDWKCKECNSIVHNKSISNIKNKMLSCPKCSDGISYPEKFMYSLLMQLLVDFDIQKTFSWSEKKRYDFYLPKLDIIIEIHGEQHYRYTGRGRSLQEEQENDRVKELLAKENYIQNYIIIDARESNLEWIKKSIFNSALVKLLDLNNVDWNKIEKDSICTLVKTVCELWNNSYLKSTQLIGEQVKLTRGTVRRYLKLGTTLGWCDYEAVSGVEYVKRKVVRISQNNNEIVEYESISEAMRMNGFKNDSRIIRSCQGKTKQYSGFIFMYYDEFLDVSNKKIQ